MASNNAQTITGRQVSMVGVTGNYPNGGFPRQAFYGMNGYPVATANAVANPVAQGEVFGTSTTAILLAIVVLTVGGYALYHFTS